MSLQGNLLKLVAAYSDRRRDAAIPLPTGVTGCCNISYGPHGKWNMLDVYYPDGTAEPLPTIVSIHGGGYVYGSKEVYRRYGMDMARRGFAFVNFNYRLAPRWKFPKPLSDINHVMQWICRNSQQYHLDPQRILLVGDSVGAQLASQYAAIWSNPGYAAHFSIELPPIYIRALSLGCGIYDLARQAALPRRGPLADYLGTELPAGDPRLAVLDAIGPGFPPTYLFTAYNDFLLEHTEPMCDLLTERGILCRFDCYGSEEARQVGHIFHMNIRLPEAVACNDATAAFFRECMEDL